MLALMAGAWPIEALAGGYIRGRIQLSPKALRTLKDVHKAPGVKPEAPLGLADAVVSVREIPEKSERSFASRARKARVNQTKDGFRPRVTALAIGESLLFVNQDRQFHNAFSLSPARRFDLGPIAPEKAARVRFDTTGVVQMFCDLHPGTSAYVFVAPNHAFVKPNAAGEFELPHLPGGEYMVRIWHPTLGNIVREVTVPFWGNVRMEVRY